MTTVVLIAVLGVWFAASAAAQIRVPLVRRSLRRHDPCHLLPRYNLFAPRPVRTDLIVRYRRLQSRREFGDWIALPYPAPRRLMDGVFSPRRRARRIVYAHSVRLVRLYRRCADRPNRVVGSIPYLHLLHCVTAYAAAEPCWGVQFQVVRVSGITGEPRTLPLFRSAVHAV